MKGEEGSKVECMECKTTRSIRGKNLNEWCGGISESNGNVG